MVYRVEGKTRRGRQRARELEKIKNNSARVNERESTGRGEKNLVFFFYTSGRKVAGKISYRELSREKTMETS